jgi:hypothetical protein
VKKNEEAKLLVGYGRFIVDECIKSSEFLKKVAIFIGKGLSENNSDATNASRLFQKLYNEGFSGGNFKEEIQLNDGASMADCMQSIYNFEPMTMTSMKR